MSDKKESSGDMVLVEEEVKMEEVEEKVVVEAKREEDNKEGSKTATMPVVEPSTPPKERARPLRTRRRKRLEK